jgi:hypothetical protein
MSVMLAGAHDQQLVRRLLGFPEDRFCALLTTLGVPADRPLTPIERPDRPVQGRRAPRPLAAARTRWTPTPRPPRPAGQQLVWLRG